MHSGEYISEQNISKAFMITILSGTVVCIAVFFMCILEPDLSFMQLLFEVVSAFGTVGLSTGITPGLSVAQESSHHPCDVYRKSGSHHLDYYMGQPFRAKSKIFRRRSCNRIKRRK